MVTTTMITTTKMATSAPGIVRLDFVQRNVRPAGPHDLLVEGADEGGEHDGVGVRTVDVMDTMLDALSNMTTGDDVPDE